MTIYRAGVQAFADWVKAKWSVKPRAEDLAIMTLGLVGEAGEVSEPIKKQIRGDGPADRANLVLELGDVQHYLCCIAGHYGITMHEILDGNVNKLNAREAAKKAAAAKAAAPVAMPMERDTEGTVLPPATLRPMRELVADRKHTHPTEPC